MKGPGGINLGMRLRGREGGRGLLKMDGSTETWKKGTGRMCGRFFLCPRPCDGVQHILFFSCRIARNLNYYHQIKVEEVIRHTTVFF